MRGSFMRFVQSKGFQIGAAMATGAGLATLVGRSKEEKEDDMVPPTAFYAPNASEPRKIGTVVTPWVGAPRDHMKKMLKDEDFDVLVIGGGATGSGAALEAATRGLKVACIDASDWSAGTSGRSTKLIHGGLRYLEQAFFSLDYGKFELVQEALEERAHMLRASPFMAKPLPIMLPLYKWWEVPYMWAGAKMYDLVSGGGGAVPASFFINRDEALYRFPMLKAKGLKGAVIYYDGQHNDTRMNINLVLTASQYGAVTANYTECTDFLKDEDGKVCGITATDRLTGERFKIKAKAVVNATGCFSDALRLKDQPEAHKLIQPSAGVHLVLADHFCPDETGLIIPKTEDGRVLFLLPWEGGTLAGTTDAPCDISMSPRPKQEDVDFILREMGRFLDKRISNEDVLAAWSGIRPLVKDPVAVAEGGDATQKLSRSHLLDVSPSGLVSIMGGKWTTYRRMGEDTIDKVLETIPSINRGNLRPSVTTKLQLIGADRVGIVCGHKFDRISQTLRNNYGLDKLMAESLTMNYGTRALQIAEVARNPKYAKLELNRRIHSKYPFMRAEVLFAIDQEYAVKAEDVIARRTRLAFLDSNAAREALPAVVDLMGDHLKWGSRRRKQEIKECLAFLDTMNV